MNTSIKDVLAARENRLPKSRSSDPDRHVMLWADPVAKSGSGVEGPANAVRLVGSVEGRLHLTMNIELVGDVEVSSVIVDRGGRVEGRIHADRVEVHGEIDGSVAADFIHLRPGARVIGTVTYAQLRIDEGAVLDAEFRPKRAGGA